MSGRRYVQGSFVCSPGEQTGSWTTNKPAYRTDSRVEIYDHMRRLLEAIVEGAETRKDSVNHSPFIVLFLFFFEPTVYLIE